MKITNASAGLINETSIQVEPDGIRIGEHPAVSVSMGLLVIIIGLGYFLPGDWWIYWVVAIILGFLTATKVKDTRKLYTADKIESVTVLGMQRVGTKDGAGSLGGAALGGLVFGGAGAVVGAVAAGNTVAGFKDTCIVFTDGEWMVVSSEDGLADVSFRRLVKLAGNRNQCPVARRSVESTVETGSDVMDVSRLNFG